MDDSPRDWQRKLGDGPGKYWFAGQPQRLGVGDLLFFAYDHQVRAYAEALDISFKPKFEKPWIVTVSAFIEIKECTEYFRGYPQLRYLDVFGKQYQGAYRHLARRLKAIAKKYHGR